MVAGGEDGGDKKRKWVSEHMQLAERQGKPWPLPRGEQSAWFTALPDREQEIILFHRDSSFVDSSQSVSRARPVVADDVLPTLLPGTHMWSRELQRPLLGVDFLSLQGLPLGFFTELSDNRQCDLAGNSFSTPVVLSVLMAIVMAASTNKADSQSQLKPVRVDLLSAFELANSQSQSGSNSPWSLQEQEPDVSVF